MIATKTTLTAEQIASVLEAFLVYRNTGSACTGKWIYQPKDFDSSFELWSACFRTRREAIEAAFAELNDPSYAAPGDCL